MLRVTDEGTAVQKGTVGRDGWKQNGNPGLSDSKANEPKLCNSHVLLLFYANKQQSGNIIREWHGFGSCSEV